jgi:hypothetical protein
VRTEKPVFYDWVGVTIDGFVVRDEPDSLIRWRDVLRVLLIFRPDPFADEDLLWLVEARGRSALLWVGNPTFDLELRRQLNVADAPAPLEWRSHSGEKVDAYVVWPPQEVGPTHTGD